MRVLHLSDFHIVHDETLRSVAAFQKKVASLGIHFPLSASRDADRQRLLNHLNTHEKGKIDAIVFSGDATSLGDDKSMQQAGDFLRAIAQMCLRENDPRNCIAIPGNHDTLEYGLRVLLGELKEKVGPSRLMMMRLFSGDVINGLLEALSSLFSEIKGPDSDFKLPTIESGGFREFLQFRFAKHFDPYSSDSIKDSIMLRTVHGNCINGDDIQLNFCPINTLPVRPLFSNMGMITGRHLNNIVSHQYLSAKSQIQRSIVNLAISHHGLMPLSKEAAALDADESVNMTTVLEHSISSQINGYLLGKALQAAGFDAHLHGHEHQNTTIRFDFDVDKFGSIYSVGIGPAFGSHEHSISFAIHEFPSPFCMSVENHTYDLSISSFKKKTSDIIFDKDKLGNNTKLAKKEITDLFFRNDERKVSPEAQVSGEIFAEKCDKLLVESSQGILIFGVKLKTLRHKILSTLRDSTKTEDKEALRRRFVERGLDILIVKPMSSPESYTVYDNKEVFYEVSKLKEDWRKFFEDISTFTGADVNTLIQKCRLRYTSTPIAHAGTCEYILDGIQSLAQPKFSRALIQTIRVVEAFDNEIFLQLDRRMNNGLLKYYAGSAWNLWNSAGVDGELFREGAFEQISQ